MGHTNFVGTPIKKKRNGTGHPKCLVCALADVPAGAPLLKVYAYGPFGARFFLGHHHFDWLDGGTAIGAKRDRFCVENRSLSLLSSLSRPASSVYKVCVCLDDASEPPR